MPSLISPALVGFTLSCALFAGLGTCLADQSATAGKKKEQSTLSSLGIDFGAAELARFAELGLDDEQKKASLNVLRDRKPTIDKLCTRMTKALMMEEATIEAKEAKAEELGAIVEEFKLVQEEIMSGLHAVVTPEQAKKLDAIKKSEAKAKAQTKSKSGSAAS